jgi:hypothetical protein
MRGAVLQLDKQQHIGLQGRQALDDNGLAGQRCAVTLVRRVFNPRTRHVLNSW